MYIDPVSGEVLGSRRFVQPGLLTFAHQLHGNFLMSRETGRPFVGWLGVAMCLLGISGLVLWWPKRGQWKYAFKVRSTATGLRFHRELHAATGIWIFRCGDLLAPDDGIDCARCRSTTGPGG
jgi:uncharacterized iron-regulated membrane protein